MNKIARIGVDLAKNVMQLHGVDMAERVVVRKAVSREKLLEWFANREPCVIASASTKSFLLLLIKPILKSPTAAQERPIINLQDRTLGPIALLRGESMFKHLLVPTDGSPLSEMAVQKAVAFAKEAQAKVTGLHVIPEFHIFTYRAEMLEDTKEQYAQDAKAHAEKYLAVIAQAATQAGVPCETTSVISDHPYEAIIKIAADRSCDLIVMASHGRSGVQGQLIGSETQKVLTHSKLPVLVYR